MSVTIQVDMNICTLLCFVQDSRLRVYGFKFLTTHARYRDQGICRYSLEVKPMHHALKYKDQNNITVCVKIRQQPLRSSIGEEIST